MGGLHLIGTVGDRGVLLKPDGTTAVVEKGDIVELGDGAAKVDSIDPHSITLVIAGKKKQYMLEAAPELRERAASLQSSSNDVSGGGTSR
jgi:hypothetical protein